MNLFIIAMLTLLGCSIVLAIFAVRLNRSYQKDVDRLTRHGQAYIAAKSAEKPQH